MPYWLITTALSGAVLWLWGGTPYWVERGYLHGGGDWVLYALLVAVPLTVIGILATRLLTKPNFTPPPHTAPLASN